MKILRFLKNSDYLYFNPFISSYVSGIANSQVTPSFNGSEMSRNLIPSRTSSNGDRDIGARSHRLVKITVIKEPSPG